MLKKFFKNILSFETETRKRENTYYVRNIFRFLGVKFSGLKYKYLNNFSDLMEYYIYFSWQTLSGGEMDPVFYRHMQNFELAAFMTKTVLPKYVQLVLISYMIEDRAYAKADYLLNQYLEQYTDKDIHEWLVISNYIAKTTGTDNKKILNASRLYEIFEKSENDNVIANFLKNKTVAVVGNGPCEKGKNKGKEIDGHDVVIRFNDYPNDEKFYADYGKKINLWQFGIALNPNMLDRADLSELKMIVMPVPFKRRRFTKEMCEKLLEMHDKNVIIAPGDSKFLAYAGDTINTTFPTGGYVMLQYALKIVGGGLPLTGLIS